MSNQQWEESFDSWMKGQLPDETLERLLRKYRKLGIDLKLIQKDLSILHANIDREFLDPKLLPIPLLLKPEDWEPKSIKINELAYLNLHREVNSDLQNICISGTLNRVLKGECSLYGDLPPIPIRAYYDGLNKEQRQLCRSKKISILEHLATKGYDRFKNSKPVATGLDRYHTVRLPNFEKQQCTDINILVLINGSHYDAQGLAIQGGWDAGISQSIQDLEALHKKLINSNADWITICHRGDEIANGARYALAEATRRSPKSSIITCDDVIHYQHWPDGVGYDHRQYRSSISPFRLYTRGSIGGLLTIRKSLLTECIFRNQYSCLESLRLEILLQAFCTNQTVTHCHHPLVRCSSETNPYLPERGWPAERSPFNHAQCQEIDKIRRYHSMQQFRAQHAVKENPIQQGSHNLRNLNLTRELVSILIPFKDKVDLTRSCVESILKKSKNEIPFEIILIDNGSTDPETRDWISEITKSNNISCIRIDEPFNYSRLNNTARKVCKGSHLLFLNNDIEWCSDNILQQLFDPFIHPTVAAVGAKLNYPDGSIQHQGVVIIPGERRCVLEPGKHLEQPETIESLIPLKTQEEFSAASAACLMVKAEYFDAVNGFDEELAVVFNDVDLCLKLRKAGYHIVVTPHPQIIHHESVSRGKDQLGEAWIRHQREQGFLRYKHRDIYHQGDPLTSSLLHHHSNRYEPAPKSEGAIGIAREQILFTWTRSTNKRHSKPPLIFAQFEADPETPIRADIINLLRQYRRHYYVQVVAATPALLDRSKDIRALKSACDGLLVRRNEGYDYGSWMTGIRFCRHLIDHHQKLILCNDSFWGPIHPVDTLVRRLDDCNADVVGLTDNLMYEPHLQSPFLLFNKRAIACHEFWKFWDNIKCWPNKRDIVKRYEVGLPVLLRNQGLTLSSLYSNNANGNILHAEWATLITKKQFPFIKVSLLKENPNQVDISNWESIVNDSNPKLAREIKKQLQKSKTNY